MEQHDRAAFAALQLGDQMVQALPRIWRNGALTQRANRIFHGPLWLLRRALICGALCDEGQVVGKAIIHARKACNLRPLKASDQQKVRNGHHIPHQKRTLKRLGKPGLCGRILPFRRGLYMRDASVLWQHETVFGR